MQIINSDPRSSSIYIRKVNNGYIVVVPGAPGDYAKYEKVAGSFKDLVAVLEAEFEAREGI